MKKDGHIRFHYAGFFPIFSLLPMRSFTDTATRITTPSCRELLYKSNKLSVEHFAWVW